MANTPNEGPNQTQQTQAAIDAVIQAAHNQTSALSSRLLVDSITAALQAVQSQDTVNDSALIVTTVKSATRYSAGSPNASSLVQETEDTDRTSTQTERTVAAITAAVKAGMYQKTNQDSEFLVIAITAVLEAAQNIETAEYSQLILAAVKAAVPTTEPDEERSEPSADHETIKEPESHPMIQSDAMPTAGQRHRRPFFSRRK